MRVVSEDEKVLFTAGSEYLGIGINSPFDALTITDKRIYHLDKSASNYGRFSTMGVEEIKKVSYKLTRKSRLAFFMIFFGTIFLVLGLLFLLNGLAVWEIFPSGFSSVSAILGYVFLPIAVIMFMVGLIELFRKTDAYLSLEYLGGELKAKIGVLKMDTLIDVRNAIFNAKDMMKNPTKKEVVQEILPPHPQESEIELPQEPAAEEMLQENLEEVEEENQQNVLPKRKSKK